MATKYVSSALLVAYRTDGRTALTIGFWLWGVVGLFGSTLFILTNATGTVGVGTSAYITMILLYWIGGMLMFGLGALLINASYDFKRPSESSP